MSELITPVICVIGDGQRVQINQHEKNAIKRGLKGATKGENILVYTSNEMSKTLDDTKIYGNDLKCKGGNLDSFKRSSTDRHTPVTCIVVGDDLLLLNDLLDIAKKVDTINFIVINGHGRATDLLSYIYKSLNESNESSIINKAYSDYGDDMNIENFKVICQQLQSIKNKMTLWCSKDEKGLDIVIQDTLFELFQGIDIVRQLDITTAWDRYDFAEQLISDKSDFLGINKKVLKKYLTEGLIKNKVLFVGKLLRSYNKFEGSLPPEELYDIYQKSVKLDKEDRAARLFKILFFPLKVAWPSKVDTFFSDVGDFIEKLLADTYLNPYSKNNDNGGCMNKVCSKDLFCWGLLLNRCDMAALFWTRGDNYTCAALFASAVLRKLSRRAKDFGDTDLARSMKNNAKIFERYACVIVNSLHASRGKKSHDLLVSVVKQYGNTTPLYIAGNHNLMDFMEQTACQAKLTDIWNGNIAWNTSLLKIMKNDELRYRFPKKWNQGGAGNREQGSCQKFGCIFFPFVLLPTIKFNCDEHHCNAQTYPEMTENTGRYYTVLGSPEENKIGLTQAIYSFYSAPAIKFMTSVAFYAVYLMTFSIMIMTNLHDLEDGGVSFLEMIVIFWTVTFLFEEVRQMIEEDQPSASSKIKLWFSSTGNKFDLVAYVMLMLSIGARFVLPTSMFRWARYSYSITVVIFWWISMRFLFVHRHIGPKVVMIGKMLTDLVFLIMIFAVVIISVGIAYNANIYPNAIFDWETVKKIVFYPYWQMHGELFLDYIRGKEPDPPGDCTYDPVLFRNGTLPACPVQFDMITMIAVVYLVLLDIILVNVLIAMFSYTFMKVQSRAEKVARFHNYFLVHEYSNMPTLIAPFNVINLLYRLLTCCCRDRINKFKIKLQKDDEMEMTEFEIEALETTVLQHLLQNDFKVSEFRSLSHR